MDCIAPASFTHTRMQAACSKWIALRLRVLHTHTNLVSSFSEIIPGLRAFIY
jgi:hypothetical protein